MLCRDRLVLERGRSRVSSFCHKFVCRQECCCWFGIGYPWSLLCVYLVDVHDPCFVHARIIDVYVSVEGGDGDDWNNNQHGCVCFQRKNDCFCGEKISSLNVLSRRCRLCCWREKTIRRTREPGKRRQNFCFGQIRRRRQKRRQEETERDGAAAAVGMDHDDGVTTFVYPSARLS